MSLSALTLPASLLNPTAIPDGSSAKEPSVSMVKRSLRPVQWRSQEGRNSVQELQVRGNIEDNLRSMKVSTNISRRDLSLSLVAAASLGVSSVSLPETAEARVVKPETRKKIFEKLKMLREKAGVSKTKSENGEKATPPLPSAEELKLIPSLPLPNLKNSSRSSLIEVTLP